MSVSNIALDPAWRDYWGMWSAIMEPLAAPLEQAVCMAPRLVLAPSLDQFTIPSSGKIEFNFHVPPGSVIWGLLVAGGVFQLTDVAVGHALFQEPVAASDSVGVFVGDIFGDFTGNLPSYFLLPTPWPVVGDGLFTLEAWGSPGDNFLMLLLVAEATACPQR